jgi:hypothetical protein
MPLMPMGTLILLATSSPLCSSKIERRIRTTSTAISICITKSDISFVTTSGFHQSVVHCPRQATLRVVHDEAAAAVWCTHYALHSYSYNTTCILCALRHSLSATFHFLKTISTQYSTAKYSTASMHSNGSAPERIHHDTTTLFRLRMTMDLCFYEKRDEMSGGNHGGIRTFSIDVVSLACCQ